jgi:PKD repeat protein
MNDFNADSNEIGFGRATNGPTRYYAIHTSWESKSNTFVTGVVYQDQNANGRYDAGEGLGDVTVSITGLGQVQTMLHGGYSVAAPDGDYTVSCSGNAFVGEASAQVTVAGQNVAVDFASARQIGEVDFAFQFGVGPPPPPTAGVTASQTIGSAPLTVDFTAETDDPESLFSWDMGDGTELEGQALTHTFNDPGLYVVSLRVQNSSGLAKALTVIAVSGAAGAGEGTTPPLSTQLNLTKVKAKANFAKAGKDSIVFKGTIEMPAGYTAAPRPAQVCLMGVTLDFELTAKNKAKDIAGNSLKLKVKLPKDGTPLGAGVIATISGKLKGDFAELLDCAGMRNATEVVTLVDVPFSVQIVEQAWAGTTTLAVKGKAGKKSAAKIQK